MTRLSHLVDRGRAFEILLSSDDYLGELAERYGPETRARSATLAKTGYQQRSETELNLGPRLAEIHAEP